MQLHFIFFKVIESPEYLFYHKTHLNYSSSSETTSVRTKYYCICSFTLATRQISHKKLLKSSSYAERAVAVVFSVIVSSCYNKIQILYFSLT